MANTDSTDWVDLDDLEVGEAWIDEDESVRWRANRLFDVAFPFSTDVETERTMGVYVEVDPGDACEVHTHDVEEVALVHRGTVEFTVGDEVTSRTAGELCVVPAGVRHGFRNVGDGPAGVLGILPTKDATTTFERVVRPLDAREVGPDGPVPEDVPDG